ncbi:hypothetical protein SAMN06265338_103191 [Rhodoblastus acidophilus]|uniref:DUF5076 domain-containing protein n=1 Tax=Rhodoblastus acidophilus TaxID=1074 RepID=A0A212RB33_RHOAC|nr:hypothetical protein [Rhodoblastus acidophilus]PPQ39348.1 hypothetical protein CKO16_06230 [Rhodoblastus acidophilus]RAI22420.1 hypothetical protein CH337_05425 [Rhodoblastus acidophilus]SNB69272.1 hypothetical protein SAMN06265338_103191 [Rhodoblastus acidophilus]
MTRDLIQRAVEAASKPDALTVLVSVHEAGDQPVAIELTAFGFGPAAYVLFAAEALMFKAREGMSVEDRCRLDYLRHELLRFVEEHEEAEPAAVAPIVRPTALN